MPIRVLAFDLDDTLLDTTRLLLPVAYTPEYFRLIEGKLPLLEGASENLRELSKRYILVLVTQGVAEIQNKKIEALGIRDSFKRVYITGEKSVTAKRLLFEQLRSDFQLNENEFLSIGNRRTTDIRNAKRAGGLTCLFRYGEHQAEPIEHPEDKPDFEVSQHGELVAVCQL